MNASTMQTVDSAASTATATTDAGEPGDSADQPPSSADSADSDIPPEPTAADNLQIDVADDRALTGAPHVNTGRIAELLRAAAACINQPIHRVSVRLIDELQMKSLHNQTIGDPVVTDVLSFDATEPGSDQPVEADIAICVDIAAAQSALRGHDIEHELLLYALHGLLHCCGYDDHNDTDYQIMHDEEDRILAAIGVGPTFARHGDRIDGD